MFLVSINLILICFNLFNSFRRNFASPLFFIFLGLAFYCLPNFITHIFTDISPFSNQDGFYFYNIGILSFVTVILFFRKNLSSKIEIPESTLISSELSDLITFSCLAVYFIGVIATQGFSVYFSLNRAMLYEVKSSNSSIFVLEFFLSVSQLFFFSSVYLRLRRNTNYKKFTALYIIILAVILFPTGARGKLIAAIFGLLFLLMLFNKLKPWKFVIPGLLIGIFFQLFGKVRHLTNDPAQILIFLKERFEWSMLDISKVGEARSNALIFNDVYNNGFIERLEPRFKSITSSYELLIPNFVLQRDFNGLSYWYVEKYYPETAKIGGGKGFSILGEGLMINEFIGSAVVLMLISVCFITFLKILSQSRYPYLGVIFAAALLLDFFQLPRISFAAFLKAAFLFTFVPLIIFLTINYLLSYEKNRASR